MSRVARIKAGENVILLDGRGGVFPSTVSGIGRGSVEVVVDSSKEAPPPAPVDLAIAVIRAHRMETAVEKLTEVGVRRMIFFTCERSLWKGQGPRAAKKLDRYRRIVEAASKQSGRAWFPDISGPLGFEELAGLAGSYGRIILADSEGLKASETGSTDEGTAALGIVGPEGGLTAEEVSMLEKSGAEKLSLGAFRLRTETAAVCLAYQMVSKTL
jgi:16S rRNA (uracil1498-N3)-methyltransferase